MKIMFVKVCQNDIDFWPIEITSTKYVETTSILCPLKLHKKVWQNDVEIRHYFAFEVLM